MNPWLYLFFVALALSALGFVLYFRERSRLLQLRQEVQHATSQASRELVHDKVTGLLTRAGFEAALDQAVQKADAQGEPSCVLYLGLDNFGLLNDAFGQHAGDRALQDVSKRLMLIGEVQACRVTSAEFALLMPGAMAAGRQMALRVSQCIAEPFHFEQLNTSLSCSIGIAEYPSHGSRANILAHSALAMRSVKLNGGDDFCQYDHQMGVVAREQAVLINELRIALEQGQLELYFQPKVDAVSLQVTAAEALLRWHHPELGFVSPMIFIPLAERFGLIGAIGNWVIEEACRKAAQWRTKGLRMRVAVNISGYQMREDDLVERIEAALARHQMPPERFTCEITESVAMEDSRLTQSNFEKMRNAGFHVSIDDFGTGYSSLAALRRLPAAELKVDRAFVTDLEHSEDARLITRSIVNMAKALILRVVAEGVETMGQCELLVAMGCNELQGYLFAKPMNGDDLQRLALDIGRPDRVDFRKSLYSESFNAAFGGE